MAKFRLTGILFFLSAVVFSAALTMFIELLYFVYLTEGTKSQYIEVISIVNFVTAILAGLGLGAGITLYSFRKFTELRRTELTRFFFLLAMVLIGFVYVLIKSAG